MFGVYMFLWFRQRSLYEHPSMQEQSKRWLKRFSWMSAIIVVGAGLFITLYVIVYKISTNTNHGCTRTEFESYAWNHYVNISIVFIGQGSMLFLLLYPLSLNVTASNSDRVIRIMNRSAVFATVGVLSDGTAMLIILFIASHNSLKLFTFFVYDINMIVHIACVLFSFESWRNICVSPFALCLFSEIRVQTNQTPDRASANNDGVRIGLLLFRIRWCQVVC